MMLFNENIGKGFLQNTGGKANNKDERIQANAIGDTFTS